MLRRAAILLVVILALAQAGVGEKAEAQAGVEMGKISLQDRAPDEMVDVIIVLKDQPAFGIAEKIREKSQAEQKARKEIRTLVLTEKEGQVKEKAKELFAEREKTNKEIENETERAVLTGQAELSTYIETQGGQVKGSTVALNAIHARVPARLAKELEKRGDVAQVSEVKNNFRLHLDTSVPTINASAWWNAGYNGSGTVKVAVIDTGVNTSHSWLNASGRTFEEKSFVPWAPDPEDGHGHGSHVAGIIASVDQTYRGVAYGLSKLVNARIFDSSGASTDTLNIENALEWSALNKSAQVLSNSWGTSYKPAHPTPPVVACSPTSSVPDGESAFVKFLDTVADDYQATLVFSAGNDGECGNISLSEEASAYNTIVVGAVADQSTQSRADDAIAYFSSRGLTYDGRKKPDITAPGYNIQSVNYLSNASPATMSGTSQAAPHVSGAAALLSEYGLTPLEVKALLINAAEDRGTPGWDNAYGWGYLDLGKAFAYRNDTQMGNVSDQGDRYYTGTIASKATITWNRHVPYAVNDLDLYMYSTGNGSMLDKSDSWKDNVEQVEGSGQVVLKVHGYNVSNIAAETYGLASDGDVAVAQLGAYYNATNSITAYDNSTFNISASIGVLDLPLHAARISIMPNALVDNYTTNIGSVTGNTTRGLQLTPKALGNALVTTELNTTEYNGSFELQAVVNVTIIDDDAEAPNITANRTSGDTLAGNYLLAVNASDASGWRLDVEYRYGNGSVHQLNTSQTNGTANTELNYTINESEWMNYTGQTLWWRYRAVDLDADRANDSSATNWTGWAAAGLLGNVQPSTPAQEYPVGIGLIGDADFRWTGSTDTEGQNITYEIEIDNQTANTTARNYTASLAYGAHAWRLRAWDGYNYSDYTTWANFSLVLIEANLSIANDSQYNWPGSLGLNATLTARYGSTQDCAAEINSSVLNGTNSTREIGILAENSSAVINWTLAELNGTGNVSLLVTCNNQTNETRVVNVTIADLAAPVLAGMKYNGTLEAGENQTIEINATDNYAVDAVWVETATGNYTANLTNGTYVAAWTPQIGTWNFTVWANDTFGNKANESGSFNVTDTIKPTISIGISPVVAARGQNVSITVIASDYLIDALWANVTHGNTSELLFGENITFTNTTETGDYNITAYANDTTGNTANASGGFTVTEPVQVMLQMNEGNMEINANDSIVTYANESRNLTIGAYVYDFVYRTNGTYRISLTGLNITENTTFSTQAEEIPANQTPGITHALLLNRTIAFRPNITANGTELGVNATVCINQTGLNYTNGYLRIYKCEWDFGNGTCTGAWQELSTYIAADMACTNVSGFSAFALAENQKYCGNGIVEAGETCGNCAADAGACPSVSSGGGNNGGPIVMPPKNKTQANATANKTEIKPAAKIEPEPAAETIDAKIERLGKEIELKKQGNYNTSALELMLGLAKEQYGKGNLALAGGLLSDVEAGLANATKNIVPEQTVPEQVTVADVVAVPADKTPVFYVLVALLIWVLAMIALIQKINPQSQDQAHP